MARHLHPQAGGDPTAQGPARELANEPRSPGADNDFPDVPDENRPSGGPAGETGDDDHADDAGDDAGDIDD